MHRRPLCCSLKSRKHNTQSEGHASTHRHNRLHHTHVVPVSHHQAVVHLSPSTLVNTDVEAIICCLVSLMGTCDIKTTINSSLPQVCSPATNTFIIQNLHFLFLLSCLSSLLFYHNSASSAFPWFRRQLHKTITALMFPRMIN